LDDVLLVVLPDDAETRLVADDHSGHILDVDRRAVVRRQHRIAEVVQRVDQTDAAHNSGLRPEIVCGSRQLAASPSSPAERGPREGLRAAVRFGFNPKKSGPDHAVPVIFPARAESER